MESTLALKLVDIQAKLGIFMGKGRGAAFGDPPWDSYTQNLIDDATQSGLRRFYWPEPLEGTMVPYAWSFMKPTASLGLEEGVQTIQLPDDFGGFDSKITCLTATSTSQPWRIEWRNEGDIRQMYSVTPTMTGPPMFAAEQPIKGTTPTAGQRFQLFLFPTPDQGYTLQVQYYLNPDYLTNASPYAYGGAQHIETILESCIAVMEERLDDMSGVHAAAFQRRMAASIGMDMKNKSPKLGYNRDRSDDRYWDRSDVHYYSTAATYNGQPFD